MKSLHEDVTKQILPKEYEGQGETIQEITNRWNEKLDKYHEYLLNETNYGYDEKLSKQMNGN